MPRPIAVTMGEPAGIGGDITLAAWASQTTENLPTFFIIDSPDRLARLAALLRLDVPIRAIDEPDEAEQVFADALPVLPLGGAISAQPGKPEAADALQVIAAIDRAVGLCRDGRCAAMVTNPINKKQLYDAGFSAPGHTEYLEQQFDGHKTAMLLEIDGLRVVPATIHVALRRVPDLLTEAGLVEVGALVLAALARDFGCPEPKLAVAGLNPHAGESGALGDEEVRIIAPAVARLRAAGHAVDGPISADTLFHEVMRRRYDAILCMYHDQALIPLKTLDFESGVNITIGLPIVRTSPDHGTAFRLAGTGTASPRSFIRAVHAASRIAQARRATDG